MEETEFKINRTPIQSPQVLETVPWTFPTLPCLPPLRLGKPSGLGWGPRGTWYLVPGKGKSPQTTLEAHPQPSTGPKFCFGCHLP